MFRLRERMEEIERGPSPKEGQQPQFFGYEGQKYFPHGVVVDSSGNIFVAEAPPKHSIIKFNGDGNFVEKWGSQMYGERGNQIILMDLQ